MNCRHTSRFPITGTSRKINENARPSGLKLKLKSHEDLPSVRSRASMRSNFCSVRFGVTFDVNNLLTVLGFSHKHHPLSLRSPGGAGILNLPLKTNFTKKFRSPLEIGESSGYCKGIGHEHPIKAVAAVTGATSDKNTFLTRSILGEWCRSNPGVSLITCSTHSPFFCALNSARKDNEKSSIKGGNK